VRAIEQGRASVQLEPGALKALKELQQALDERPKDWELYQRQAREFHLKNAQSWANRAVGQDLSAQIDPTFVLA
jgi:CO dehydrogenase maturation factor